MLISVNSTISTGREGLSPTKFSAIRKAGIDIVEEELTPSGVSTMDGMHMCSYV